jgi:hypothetical protein
MRLYPQLEPLRMMLEREQKLAYKRNDQNGAIYFLNHTMHTNRFLVLPYNARFANEEQISVGRPLPRTRGWLSCDRIAASQSSLRRRFHKSYGRYDKLDPTAPSKLQSRIEEVFNSWPEPYPRLGKLKSAISCLEYVRRYGNIKADETLEQESVVLNGKLKCRSL